jgi:Zn-dependent metalloprotease
MHAFDQATAPAMARLSEERASHAAFAGPNVVEVTQLDPETVATRYLRQALQSDTVKAFTAPKSGGVESQFKTIGTETVPLTGTKTVKFRQTLNSIPVYGSLVTVELDDQNNLVSLGSALGEPQGVDGVATIAPADAVKAVENYPGFRKQLDDVVPHLNYYFDQTASKWRLVFILEDVPVAPSEEQRKVAPRYMDYIVDAHSGQVVAERPRTPSMAASVENVPDGRGVVREISVEIVGQRKVLRDAALNVQTFDFRFLDPSVDEDRLPGRAIANPPNWSPSAVSAHANAGAVAKFLREVLLRNNIDDKGSVMNSSINCVVAEESPGQRQWFNAFWNGQQMVYGQRLNGNALMSLSIDLDVVAHEMFHGVTEATARLEYAGQSGALNESYSDIFGIIVANFSTANTRDWNWKIGEGLSPDGKPFRDMSNPAAFGQPAHMKDFKVLPNNRAGDWGGVHTNSGIHNKAAYNILMAADPQGEPVLKTARGGRYILFGADATAVAHLAVYRQSRRRSQQRPNPV